MIPPSAYFSSEETSPLTSPSVVSSPQGLLIQDSIVSDLIPADSVSSDALVPDAVVPDSFSSLGLTEKVMQTIDNSGYKQPTPIQAQAIPYILKRRDVLGIAQTGTGKTAAFTLPMLSLLEQGRARARMPRTLILEPTRELAAQVETSFEKYGANHKLSVALLIGGVSFGDQDTKITRGADVLIATPGRLLDHFERGKLLLTGIEILVIDEADRMLDMGFIPDIERIANLCPFTRQTLFFTATMPPEIQRITAQFLSSPVTIEVARPSSTAVTIAQKLVATRGKDYEKREKLREILRAAVTGEDSLVLKNGIIFCNRKREVAALHRSLTRHGFSVGALHGDMDQRARMNALEAFRKNELTLLVASDVAARGLDIPDVSHVFNYDLPHHAEDYVHRIGRTGRAGRMGAAFSLVTRGDEKSLAAIEKLIGNSISWQGEPLSFSAEEEEETSTEERRPLRGGRSRTPIQKTRSTRPEKNQEKSQESSVVPENGATNTAISDDNVSSRPVSTRPKRELRSPQYGGARGGNNRPPREKSAVAEDSRPNVARPSVARTKDSYSNDSYFKDSGPDEKGFGDFMPGFMVNHPKK